MSIPPQEQSNDPIGYFVSGDILFTLAYEQPSESLTPTNALASIVANLSPSIEILNSYEQTITPVLTFSMGQSGDTTQVTVLKMTLTNGGETAPNDALQQIVNELQAVLENQPSFEDYRLVSLALNWYSAPAHLPLITGEPAAYPVRNGGGTGPQFSGLPLSVQAIRAFKRSPQVRFAVLDTTPVTVENTLSKVPNNSIFKTSIGASQVTVADPSGSAMPTNGSLMTHQYDMVSHGLFVANMLATMVPSAQIEMVRVLNDQGVGTYETLLAGFNYCLKLTQDLPLVINCSLTLQKDPSWSQAQFTQSLQTLDVLCQTLLARDDRTYIVAAAGNEAQNNSTYPASFSSVMGVGALDDLNQTSKAWYSNKPDTGPMVLAYGGKADFLTRLTDNQKGILGLHFENTYKVDSAPPVNMIPTRLTTDGVSKGNARWAGTSFAAPIVSAVIGLLMACCGVKNFQVEARLKAEYPLTSPTGEHIITVHQV